MISKKVKIGNNVTISSFSHLEGVKIDNNVKIGPYARIRPGVIIKSGSKIGNFVEVKKSKIGKNSKVNHLSYIGDTSIGKTRLESLAIELSTTLTIEHVFILFFLHISKAAYVSAVSPD